MALPQPMFTQRDQVLEYRLRLQQASGEPAVQTVLQLLNLHIDQIKEKLLKVPANELEKWQGTAQGYMEVRKWILEPLNGSIDNK